MHIYVLYVIYSIIILLIILNNKKQIVNLHLKEPINKFICLFIIYYIACIDFFIALLVMIYFIIEDFRSK